MLLGRIEAPLPAARRNKDSWSDSGDLNQLDDAHLAAELAANGRAAMWVRLAPHDLDPVSLASLAGAVLAKASPGEAWSTSDHSRKALRAKENRLVVLESPDPRPDDEQTATFLAQLSSAWPHPQTRPDVMLRRDDIVDSGRAGIVRNRRAPDRQRVAIAAELIGNVRPQTRPLLQLTAQLGYCHPRFGSLEPVITECAKMPWWTALTGDWWQVERCWRPSVLAGCAAHESPPLPVLARLVCELVDEGAGDEAIELCLEAGYGGLASDLLADLGPNLLRADRPRAVARWLDRLPAEDRNRLARLAQDLADLTQRPRPGSTRWWWLRGRRDGRGGGEPSDPGAGPQILAGGGPTGRHPLALSARLFGELEVSIAGRPVRQWRSRKGRMMLAHLLLNRERPMPREALATALWPEAAPDAARNRLHVTLHGLRRDLRAVTMVPIVVFDRGYALNPELDIEVDVETFDRHLSDGRKALRDNEIEAGLRCFQQAVAACRGDLLTEQSGEDWTVLPRERLRVGMLDARGMVARLAFELGLYPDCIQACQELLDLDFCREDLHRLLIRAYARLDQPELAVRQFEICADQMRAEFAMLPAAETVRLLERVRARVPV